MKITALKYALPAMSLAVALLVSPPLATAATVSYSVYTPSQLTELDYLVNLPKFDLTLGTLSSVTITINADLSSVLTVTNNNVTSSSGDASTRIKFYLDDPQGDFGTSPAVFTTKTFDNSFTYTLAPFEQLVSDPITQNVNAFKNYSTGPILSEFSTWGVGTIDLALSSTTSTVLANTGGNSAASQVTSGDSTVTVTYNYAAVPEPATWTLLMGGLGIIAFAKRARKLKP